MTSDLNDIKVFSKVVEAQSFSAAARLLGLPNSTVSRRVSRLERDLGVQLLHRTTRKLSLTEQGQLYYERSARVLAELEDAENQLAASQKSPRGRVKVLVPVEHTLSSEIVQGFLVQYPEVRVDMLFSSDDVNIIQEGFDASIHIGRVTNESVVAHCLMDSPFRLVASPEYLKSQGTPENVAALSDHECIIFGPSSSSAIWDLRGKNDEEIRVPVRGRLAVNHMAAVRDAATAGLGIALLPLLSCQAVLDAGTLRAILPEVCAPAVPIYITYPGGRFLAPSVRAFVDHVRGFFAELGGATGD
jgi:DNA-binding transcriptional LysR family regulator